MRSAILAFGVLLVALVPAAAWTNDGDRCGDRPAAISLHGRAGSLVTCSRLNPLDPNNRFSDKVTLSLAAADGAAVRRQLTELVGAEVGFIPNRGYEHISFESSGQPLWRVLDAMTGAGHLIVGGLDFKVTVGLRKDLTEGGVTGSFYEVKLEDVLATLSSLTGRELVADAGDRGKLVTMKFERATLRDLLKALAVESKSHIVLKARRAAADQDAEVGGAELEK